MLSCEATRSIEINPQLKASATVLSPKPNSPSANEGKSTNDEDSLAYQKVLSDVEVQNIDTDNSTLLIHTMQSKRIENVDEMESKDAHEDSSHDLTVSSILDHK